MPQTPKQHEPSFSKRGEHRKHCFMCLLSIVSKFYPLWPPLASIDGSDLCSLTNSSLFPALVGALELIMYEKSCAVPSQCDLSGQKHISGLNFNYTNVCCDTDLCNGAGSVGALGWGRATLLLLPALGLLLA